MTVANISNHGRSKADHTRQKLLQVALRLFAKRGYASAGTQAIVHAAGVSKPVLYYYFGSKVGLFRAIVNETENELHNTILQIKAHTPDVCDQLSAICRAMFQFARDRPAVMGLAVELWLDAKDGGPTRKHCAEKARRRIETIGEIMDRGRREGRLRRQYSSEQLAMAFVNMLHFHILFHLAHPALPLTAKTARQAVSLFLNGAAAPLHRRSQI